MALEYHFTGSSRRQPTELLAGAGAAPIESYFVRRIPLRRQTTPAHTGSLARQMGEYEYRRARAVQIGVEKKVRTKRRLSLPAAMNLCRAGSLHPLVTHPELQEYSAILKTLQSFQSRVVSSALLLFPFYAYLCALKAHSDEKSDFPGFIGRLGFRRLLYRF